MTDYGYCSVEDVDRVAQSKVSETVGTERVISTIQAQTEWVEGRTRVHWYVEGGADNDEHDVIPTEPLTRSDEYDIPTKAATVIGEERSPVSTIPTVLDREGANRLQDDPKIRIATGDRDDEDIPTYTRIRLDRKYVESLNELWVIGEDGTLTDWVASDDYDGGFGPQARGKDYWVQVNNWGVTQLNIDIHSLDDDLSEYANAVYADIDHGSTELTEGVRTAVAMLTLVHLSINDEAAISIEDAGQLMNVETKADAYERVARDYGLEPHLESSW